MAHGAQTHCIQRFISAYCGGKYFAFSWAPLKIHSSRGDRHIAPFDKRQQVNQAAIVENKRLGPILAYIAEQQKQLDMSRSAKAPRRRGQKNHMFKVG